LRDYNTELDLLEVAERHNPLESRRYAYAELMNVLGYGGANLDPTASLADKEQALEKLTQDHLEKLYDMKKELSKD
jgi:hypothetical protein